MKDSEFKLLREIGKDAIIIKYKNNNRDIDPYLWKKLKAIRVCEKCNLKVSTPLYIHHKIPVRVGGTNTRENLIVICWGCHKILDAEQAKKYGEKIEVEGDELLLDLLDEICNTVSELNKKLEKFNNIQYSGLLHNIKSSLKNVRNNVGKLKEKI